MGIVKSEAQRKANKVQRDKAIAASISEDRRGFGANNWSTQMPAYSGTSCMSRAEKRRNNS